jgi:CheY-like chemotaxis protein
VGLELLRHIKQKFSHPPPVVMMITAYGDAENYSQAMRLGRTIFLPSRLILLCLKKN